jgi:hypothetical protein
VSGPDFAHTAHARRNRWLKAARLAAAARNEYLRSIHGLTGEQRAAILERADVPSASAESWALAHDILTFPDNLPHAPLDAVGVDAAWVAGDVDQALAAAGVSPAARKVDPGAVRTAYESWEDQAAASEALRLAGYVVTEETTPDGHPATLLARVTPVLTARHHLIRAAKALDMLGDAVVPLAVPPAVRRIVLLDTAAEVLDSDDPAAALLKAVSDLD